MFKVGNVERKNFKRRRRKLRNHLLQNVFLISIIVFLLIISTAWTKGDADSIKYVSEKTNIKEKVIISDNLESEALKEDYVEDFVIEETEPIIVSEIESSEHHEVDYIKDIDLPVEHQKYLYEKCIELGLDYEKTLAIIEHESKFDPNAIGKTNDYGYFQINVINHEWLSETLNTPNKPLDPYVNIEWGTYFLSELYDYWIQKGLTGKELDEAVLSSYNRGIKGFLEHGKAIDYIEKVYESLEVIKNS